MSILPVALRSREVSYLCVLYSDPGVCPVLGFQREVFPWRGAGAEESEAYLVR